MLLPYHATSPSPLRAHLDNDVVGGDVDHALISSLDERVHRPVQVRRSDAAADRLELGH